MPFKGDQLIFTCFQCKKNYQKDFDKDMINRFADTYRLCNKDINKFILLLTEGVYSYEYMDSQEKLNETSLPGKRAFYSKLYSKDITDKDYTYAQKVFEELKLKRLADYNDMYVQSDTLLLADAFENFRNKFIEIYDIDSAHFCLHQDQHGKLL